MNVIFVIQTSPNAFKFYVSSNKNSREMGHVSNHLKIFLHICIETFLHDRLKWFQTCLMTKIVHNLSSWLKTSCTFDFNVEHDEKKLNIFGSYLTSNLIFSHHLA